MARRDNHDEIMGRLLQNMQEMGGSTDVTQGLVNWRATIPEMWQKHLAENLYPNLHNTLSGVSRAQIREPQPLPAPALPEQKFDELDTFTPTLESVRDRERAVLEFKFKCAECGGYVHLTQDAKKYCVAYDLDEPALLCDER
jgi:hypothetical protein